MERPQIRGDLHDTLEPIDLSYHPLARHRHISTRCRTVVARAPGIVEAFEAALCGEGCILLVAQKLPGTENPTADDLYRIGTVGKLLRHQALPNGWMKLLVRGEWRAAISGISEDLTFLTGIARPIDAESRSPQVPFALLDAQSWPTVTPPTENCVAELQALLEDDAVTSFERSRRAEEIIRGSRRPPSP